MEINRGYFTKFKGKRRIDELINTAKTKSRSQMFQFLGIDIKKYDDVDNEYIYQLGGKLIESIDGGIEYFFNKILLSKNDGRFSDILIAFLSNTSGFDKMVELLNTWQEFELKGFCDKKKFVVLDTDSKANLFIGLSRSAKYRDRIKEILLNLDKDENKAFRDVVFDMPNILEKINDVAFSKKIIENITGNITENNMVTKGKWNFYKKYCSPNMIAEMIAGTKDTDFIKSYYLNKDCAKKINFQEEDLILLAAASKDKKIVMSYFTDSNKKERLSQYQRSQLLLGLDNKDVIREAILNPEKYGLDAIEIVKLAFEARLSAQEIKNFKTIKNSEISRMVCAIYTEDIDYIRENIDYLDGEISLPEEMTIGIEIECLGRLSEILKKKRLIDRWVFKEETTIDETNEDEGIEATSPVLSGNNRNTTRKIKTIVGMLKKVKQYTNSSCGGHIHIGADYLTSVQAFNNLKELWANNEKIFYIISNKEGELPREGIEAFAIPVSKEMENELEETIEIDDEDDLDNFKRRLAKRQEDRYKGINFKNLEEDGKGTIEFRISNGTIDPTTWIENINLYGGLVRVAQEISLIQEKKERKRSPEEASKLALFDKLGTDINLTEKERARILIELIISDETRRQTYIDRYNTNSALLELDENEEINDYLTQETSTMLIRYSDKNAIGEDIFIGPKAIKGPEIQAVSGFINNDLRRINSGYGFYK